MAQWQYHTNIIDCDYYDNLQTSSCVALENVPFNSFHVFASMNEEINRTIKMSRKGSVCYKQLRSWEMLDR